MLPTGYANGARKTKNNKPLLLVLKSQFSDEFLMILVVGQLMQRLL